MGIFDGMYNLNRQQRYNQNNHMRPRPGYFNRPAYRGGMGMGNRGAFNNQMPNNRMMNGNPQWTPDNTAQGNRNWLSDLLRNNHNWLSTIYRDNHQSAYPNPSQDNRQPAYNNHAQYNQQPAYNSVMQNNRQPMFGNPMQNNRHPMFHTTMQNNRQPMFNNPMLNNRQPMFNNILPENAQERTPPQNRNQAENNYQTMFQNLLSNNQRPQLFGNILPILGNNTPQAYAQPPNDDSRLSGQEVSPMPRQIPQQIPPEVSFEPLSDDLLQLINKNADTPEMVPQHMASAPDIDPDIQPEAHKSEPAEIQHEQAQDQARDQPTATPPAAPAYVIIDENENYAAQLENFIQSEKNASDFYRHLATLARSNTHRELFNKISGEDDRFSDRYNEIYKEYKGDLYQTQSMPFNGEIAFADGVKLAIQEEYKSLDDLTSFYEQSNDEKNREYYNSVMFKKMGDIDMMNAVLADL